MSKNAPDENERSIVRAELFYFYILNLKVSSEYMYKKEESESKTLCHILKWNSWPRQNADI